MATCKDIVDLALEYLKRELDPETSKRLEYHMERCPSCINFIRTYQAVPDVSRELLHEKMPDEVKASLMEFLKVQILTRKKSA